MNRCLMNAFSGDFWAKWLNKLFSLFVSVKILVIVLTTVLLVAKIISEATWRAVVITVVGTRGIIEVYAIRRNNNNKKVGKELGKMIAKLKSEEEK